MDAIRLSINVQKIPGTRLVKMPNPQTGTTQIYAAIPIDQLYVPNTQDAAPYLMLNAIPSPNSLYGDFMIKPYINGEDFQHMSDDEKRATPIYGKGSFMKAKVSKAMQQSAEAVQGVEFVPTVQQQAPIMPPPQVVEQAASSTPEDGFYVKSADGTYYTQVFAGWQEAATFAGFNTIQWPIVEEFQGGKPTRRYRWAEATMDWRFVDL